jgi:hypothetical protein
MDIVIVAGAEVFESALDAARREPEADPDALSSILDNALVGQIEEVWDHIEGALRQGFRFGREQALEAMAEAIEQAERLVQNAGDKAKAVQNKLLERIQTYIQAQVQGALARIPVTMPVGGQQYALLRVKCTQKLLVTGSVKASLTEAFSLASSGELEISAEYEPLSAKLR